jgi:hypothetical protein
MNLPLPAYNKTLFDIEVLRARLEIRDFFLKNLYREVYENIGQLLSLARVMLAQQGDRIEPASELVGRSIRELREMCKSFYPDDDLLKENGFSQAITKIITISFPGSEYLVKQISIAEDTSASLKLIICSMVLEIMNRIRETNGRPGLITITFTRLKFVCVIRYQGEPIVLNDSPEKQYSIDKISLQQKAGLINGKFEISPDADGIIHLKLFCPLN